ncbi:MAG: hypothetical protein V1921_07360 [Candidatus Altiarchaeota archaeon]
MKINLSVLSIEARRISDVPQNVTINNNSTVTEVKQSETALSVMFRFTSVYEPNVGVIKIAGELSLEDSKEKIESIFEQWEKSGNKNLPKDIAEKVHNTILLNCIVEATVLSREVRLPAPFPTPKIMIPDDKKDDEDDINSYIR